MNQKIRLQILGRDDYRCVACGKEKDLTIHHRVNRGAGGSKMFDTHAYLLTMCSLCNNSFEASDTQARKARTNGYKLSRNAKPPIDPTTIPVFYFWESKWYLLNNQNEKEEIING